MHELSEKLSNSLRAWQEWAQSAEKEESGWESEAPNWQELIANAQDLLLKRELGPDDLSNIERVFCYSQEGEDLADFLKDNLAYVFKSNIHGLLRSPHEQVRWQVYDSLIAADEFCRQLLLKGTSDPDDYVRRRAFLRLIEMERPPEHILKRALTDSDQVIRDQARMQFLAQADSL